MVEHLLPNQCDGARPAEVRRWRGKKYGPTAALAAGILVLLFEVVGEAATYSVVDLGEFSRPPGKTSADPEATPTQVNEFGVVTGVNDASLIFNTSEKYGGFIRTTDWNYLGTLGGGESFATGINDANVVVGMAHNPSIQLRGFVWSSEFNDGVAGNPQMRAIGTFGGTTSEATGINNAGQVTGNAATASGNYQAFRYENGALTSIGALITALPNSFGFGINDSGHIVGAAYDRNYRTSKAFYYNGNTAGLLGTLGGDNSFALAINNNNRIVGYASTSSSGFEHAFYSDAGGNLVDMGTLGGGYSYALDINDANMVVGGSFTDANNLVYRAFLYQSGGMLNLNNLLDETGNGWVLIEAKAINNAGQIVGIGRRNNQDRGFLLNPAVPAPQLTEFDVSGSAVSLKFTTTEYTKYRIEKRDTLAPTEAWTEVPEAVTGTGDEVTWIDESGALSPSKFYQIRVSQPQ